MAKKAGNILIIDDNRSILTALELLLHPYFDEVRLLTSPITLPHVLQQKPWSVVVLDMNFTSGINTGNEGIYWLGEIKRLKPQLPVVLITAYADIELAVKGIKQGATNFIVKPWENRKLVETLLTAAESSTNNKERTRKSRTTVPPEEKQPMYWGESPAMVQLRHLVEKVAATDANILITGENGTGKEMLAREIHALSSRCNLEMQSVDMGTVVEGLFESELFGHKKGAFTDAHTDREGKFEAANGSTLFMDEIGNLPIHMQAKLLTALQRRTVVRVGSNEQLPVDIRLVCATNRNLPEMVARSEFREDLLYRINTIHVEIPPLRKRTDDIIPLAELFIRRLCRRYGKPQLTLNKEAKELLCRHPWPGNIRELEHAIEKAVIICDTPHLPASLFDLPRPAVTTEATPPANETLEEAEVRMIRESIELCEGNLTAVAAKLGITRQTLYNKMKKHGI